MIDTIIARASDYKRRVAGAFISISGDDISARLGSSALYATIKIDGEFNLLWFDGETALLVNAHGTIKDQLPVTKALSKALKKKGVGSLLAAAELHTVEDKARSRITTVMSALSNSPEELTLSAFELLELNGEVPKSTDYPKQLEELEQLLLDTEVHTVRLLQANKKDDIENLFQEHVVNGGAEGLVVRSAESPVIYKIKPLISLDAAVIGYTEGDSNSIRELLLGLQNEDGQYIQIGRLGNGLSESEKSELHQKLHTIHSDSDYIEVDGRRVGFHMVRPEYVAEIHLNELLTETAKGTIRNAALQFNAHGGWHYCNPSPGVSLQNAVFKNLRADKSASGHDVRFSQVTDLIALQGAEKSSVDLPKSTILSREVYTKKTKDSVNVQKYVVWKTNKEKVDSSYPAYVLHYTNYSPTRKDPLQREVRVSNSREQIERLKTDQLKKNVKSGWSLVSDN